MFFLLNTMKQLFVLIVLVQSANSWKNHNGTDQTLFEGDIVLEQSLVRRMFESGESIQSAATASREQLWPNGRVPYKISNYFSDSDKTLIENSMIEISLSTCIQFHRRIEESAYIYIIKDISDCLSHVGYKGRMQEVWLGEGCVTRDTVLHELMHALGFWHEQNRYDRDNYVEIINENIKEGAKINFRKHREGSITHSNTEYDYSSVMHYPIHAFSKNGRPTIRPRQTGVEIKSNGLSIIDKIEINRLYQCPTKNRDMEPISNGGCNFELIADQKPRYLHSHNGYGHMNYDNKMFCKWTIKGANSGAVYLLMVAFKSEYNSNCSYDYLEVYNGVPVDPNSRPDWGSDCGFFHDVRYPYRIRSEDFGSIHLHFHTDATISESGFQFLYYANGLGGYSACGTTLIADDNVRYLYSHSSLGDHNYENNYSCFWIIRGEWWKKVKLIIGKFRLESHETCNYDKLEIYDGRKSELNKIGKYCGTQVKQSVKSTGQEVRLDFSADGSINNYGFWLVYFAED